MNPHAILKARPRWADALALAAGALLVPAYAPFELRVLAVIAPAILLLLWHEVSPRRALQLGYLFGLGQFGLGVSWIYFSLHLFGQAIAPLAALITLLFVMFFALFPALLGWLLARYARGSGWLGLVVVAPAAWVLWEWVRGWFLTGFPWLLLGHSQVDTWLGGMAPQLGVLGVSWAVMLLAGLLALGLIESGHRRWIAWGLVPVLWVATAPLGLLDWTRPAGDPLKVSLVQGGIAQQDKWKPEQFGPTLELYRDRTRKHWDSDLILWPETAVPAFYYQVEEDYLQPLIAEAREHETDLVLGIFVYEPDTGGVYNSIVSLGPRNGAYFKRHLVPFGEYIPLRGLLSWLDGLLEIPMSDLDAGTGRPLVYAAGQPIGVSICYEDAFGEEVIDALPEATLLANVSNDAWFGDSLAPHQHLEIARMRALETGRYLLRATNTGVSAIIGPRAEVLAVAPQFETHVLSAQVTPHTGLTPYGRWGNWGVVTLMVILLGLGLGAGRLRREEGLRTAG